MNPDSVNPNPLRTYALARSASPSIRILSPCAGSSSSPRIIESTLPSLLRMLKGLIKIYVF